MERGAWGWTPAATNSGLILGAILLVAAAIRFGTADYGLWTDEIASLKFAEVPVRRLWSDWMIRETNPPLYYTLLHGWIALFGEADGALRRLSASIGLIGVGLSFLLGRRVADERVGLLAAALTALSWRHVGYSQEVRGYVLADAAALAALLGAIGFCEASDGQGGRRRRALALYTGGCIVAVYAHTTLVLLPMLAGALVAVKVAVRRTDARRRLVEWTAANLLVLVAWSWWGRITWLQMGSPDGNIGWIARPTLIDLCKVVTRSYGLVGAEPLAGITAAAALLAAAIMGWRWRRRAALLLPLAAFGAPALLWLVSLHTPVLLPGAVSWASGPLIVTLAAAIGALPWPRLRIGAEAAAMGLSLAGLLAWAPTREAESWRRLTAYVVARDPHARLLTRGRGVAYALQRYCPQPCGLRLRVIPIRWERWADGLPSPPLVNSQAELETLERQGWVRVGRGPSDPPMLLPR